MSVSVSVSEGVLRAGFKRLRRGEDKNWRGTGIQYESLTQTLKNGKVPGKKSFDRLIISQGITENLPILTCDRVFNNYPVEILW